MAVDGLGLGGAGARVGSSSLYQM